VPAAPKKVRHHVHVFLINLAAAESNKAGKANRVDWRQS